MDSFRTNPKEGIMKYLTVSADCTKESRDLLSVE